MQGEQVSLHNDHLGSVTLTLASDGDFVQHSHYQPYGDAANIQPSRVQPYGFSGKERDDSGLMYFEARYYDPVSGRFISPDPLFAEQMDKCLGSVIECNLYQYTGNNPVNFTDPSGEGIPILQRLAGGVISIGATAYKAKKHARNLRKIQYNSELMTIMGELTYAGRENKPDGNVWTALIEETVTGKPVNSDKNPKQIKYHIDKAVGEANKLVKMKNSLDKDFVLSTGERRNFFKKADKMLRSLNVLIDKFDQNTSIPDSARKAKRMDYEKNRGGRSGRAEGSNGNSRRKGK